MRKPVRAVLLLTLTAGCAPTLSPQQARVGDAVSPQVDALAQAATTRAAPLAGGGFIAATADGLVRIDAAGAATAVQTSPGKIRAVATVGSRTLVAGSKGLFVDAGQDLVRSPLQDALGDRAVTALAPGTISGGELVLWMVAGGDLLLWRRGELRPVTLEGVPLSGAAIAAGPPPGGSASAGQAIYFPVDDDPALWVAAGNTIYALALQGTRVSAWLVRAGIAVASMAADRDGTLWVVSGGDLRLRARDGSWSWLRLPTAVRAVVADPASPAGDVWVDTEGGLFLRTGGVLHPVPNAPAHAGVAAGGADHLLLYGDGGFSRLRPRRDVVFAGLDEGAALFGDQAPVTVRIEPEVPEDVASIEATLDTSPVALGSPPYEVTVDPPQLGRGPHTLTVTIHYRSATVLAVTARLKFRVGSAPTWANDIGPIFRARCALCHDGKGPAHVMNTRDLWQKEIDQILYNVREKRMPLGRDPLTQPEIDLIAAWAEAGLPE